MSRKKEEPVAVEETKETVEDIASYSTRNPVDKDFKIIKYIIATEATQKLRETENAIVFAVDKKSTKLEIKAAVEALFKCKVNSVNTLTVRPKYKRVGKYSGTTSGYKKAIVRFNSAYDLGKIANIAASEETKANADE